MPTNTTLDLITIACEHTCGFSIQPRVLKAQGSDRLMYRLDIDYIKCTNLSSMGKCSALRDLTRAAFGHPPFVRASVFDLSKVIKIRSVNLESGSLETGKQKKETGTWKSYTLRSTRRPSFG